MQEKGPETFVWKSFSRMADVGWKDCVWAVDGVYGNGISVCTVEPVLAFAGAGESVKSFGKISW